MAMNRIEREAKFKFQKVGAPQPTDIIKANSRDIIHSIKKVPHEVVALFDTIADELLESLGDKEALCRALAIISGTNEKFKQRSLLCSIEGFITYTVETDVEFRNLSYIWIFLKRHFSPEITEAIKGMRCFKNKMGAAFDVPEQYEPEFQTFMDNNTKLKAHILKKADILPEFEEEVVNGRGGYNSGGGFSNGGSGFNNSYNNRNSAVLKGKDDVKVFCGGLSFDAVEHDLKDFFSREGINPVDVLILKDDQGNSRGVGFVIFGSPQDASRACQQNGKRLKGRGLRINMASDKPGSSRR